MKADPSALEQATGTSSMHGFLDWILKRHSQLDACTEIRILQRVGNDSRIIWSGCFGPEHHSFLVNQLTPLPGGAHRPSQSHAIPRSGEAALYFSLQGVSRQQQRVPYGQLIKSSHTCRDSDIAVYSLFVIDVDPVRPPGISATDAEKTSAQEVCLRIQGWLAASGVACILADSGNGFHLLVPLIPAYEADIGATARSAQALLRLLDERFSTPQAKVDLSTFNPSRILKLYGSMAIKGTSSVERPHRLSSIHLESIPEDVDLFGLLASQLEPYRQVDRSRRSPATCRPPTPQANPPCTVNIIDLPDKYFAGESTVAPRLDTFSTEHSDKFQEARWKHWREQAVLVLPLRTVYGDLLTGRSSGEGWLECRDPESSSGDQDPSAGVADGTGAAERGTFHSFRTGVSLSVFDVLVRWGRVSSFSEACRVVSKLSGLPLPRSGAPSLLPPELVERWPELGMEARQEAIRSLSARRLRRGPDAQRLLQEQLEAFTGLSSEAVRALMHPSKRSDKAHVNMDGNARALTAPRGQARPVVDYRVNIDSIATLFDAILAAIQPSQTFFRLGRSMVCVRPGTGPELITERSLPGLLSALIELRFLRQSEGPTMQLRFGILPADFARAFINDQRVLNKLPELLMYSRAPLFGPDWSFIGRPGYHPAGCYYDGPLVLPGKSEAVAPGGANPLAGLPPELSRVLSGFCFRSSTDCINFVGMLITAITLPLWGRGHGFLAINGNIPGVGKSLLARILGLLCEGQEPVTLSYLHDEAELEKQIATRIEAGDRVLIIDNVRARRALESPVLERLITDNRPAFRRLGSNTSICRAQNDLLFVLTMNQVQLGADLRRRAVPVNLYREGGGRQPPYAILDLLEHVALNRLTLVEELAGLVQGWVNEGRVIPADAARHSTGHAWSGAVDGILRRAGLPGFLWNLDASLREYDPDFELVQAVASEHGKERAAHAAEWATRLEQGPLRELFIRRVGAERTSRAKATILGTLLGEYEGTTFLIEGQRLRLERFWPEGRERKPAYRFVAQKTG